MEENSQTKSSSSSQSEEAGLAQSQPEKKLEDTSHCTPPLSLYQIPLLADAPFLIGLMKTKKYCSTELLSGLDTTAWYRNGHYGETSSLEKYHLQSKLPSMGEYQLNGVMTPQGVWKVYDIVNLMDNSYLSCMDVLKFCEDIGVMMVPMLSCGYRFGYTLDEMDKKSRNMPTKLKGIVYKTMKPEWYLKHRLAFKVENAYYSEG